MYKFEFIPRYNEIKMDETKFRVETNNNWRKLLASMYKNQVLQGDPPSYLFDKMGDINNCFTKKYYGSFSE